MCLGPLRQRSLKLSYDALPRPASGLAVIVPRKLNVEQVCLSIEWPNLGKSVCDCVELLEQRYPIGLDNCIGPALAAAGKPTRQRLGRNMANPFCADCSDACPANERVSIKDLVG